MLLSACAVSADENLDGLKREVEELKKRVTGLEEQNNQLKKEIEVDRLIVRKELIVPDTGQQWEKGFEAHQIPRGIYARSLWNGPGGPAGILTSSSVTERKSPARCESKAHRRNGRTKLGRESAGRRVAGFSERGRSPARSTPASCEALELL